MTADRTYCSPAAKLISVFFSTSKTCYNNFKRIQKVLEPQMLIAGRWFMESD